MPIHRCYREVVQITKPIDLFWHVAQLGIMHQDFGGGSVVKNLPTNAENLGLISESGRSPGEGNGYPPQCSCLGNPVNRRAWQGTVHGIAKELDMT